MAALRTRADLEQLIHDQTEENMTLEYKGADSIGRSDGRKREITKDVSALANAAGGTIVYGITETSGDGAPARPERLDAINASAFSKEWLDQILGQIRPRIPGLEIVSIAVGPGQFDCVYVVEVPQGSTAHQALDHRYYARRNFEATAMVDHEIRDVMQRSIHPSLEVDLRIIADFPHDQNSHIALRLRNVGEIMARHYAVVVRLPFRINNRFIRPKDARIVNSGLPHWLISISNNGGTPIFPAAELMISKKFSHIARIDPLPEASILEPEITLYADNMPKVVMKKSLSGALQNWT